MTRLSVTCMPSCISRPHPAVPALPARLATDASCSNSGECSASHRRRSSMEPHPADDHHRRTRKQTFHEPGIVDQRCTWKARDGMTAHNPEKRPGSTRLTPNRCAQRYFGTRQRVAALADDNGTVGRVCLARPTLRRTTRVSIIHCAHDPYLSHPLPNLQPGNWELGELEWRPHRHIVN